MSEFTWEKDHGPAAETIWRCQTKQTTIEIHPRPRYCDRGRWQVYVDTPGYPCGFPVNQKPFDHADGFPRYFFSLDCAMAEMEDLLNFRNYEPA